MQLIFGLFRNQIRPPVTGNLFKTDLIASFVTGSRRHLLLLYTTKRPQQAHSLDGLLILYYNLIEMEIHIELQQSAGYQMQFPIIEWVAD